MAMIAEGRKAPEFELACYSRRDVFYTKERVMEVGDRYLQRKGKAVK